MIAVHRDSLAESYLLIVASQGRDSDAQALERALHRAGRSGKQAVWLDCSMLAVRDSTPDLALLLSAYAEAFAAQGITLVVAHAGPELRQELAAVGLTGAPHLVNSLVEGLLAGPGYLST